MITNLLSSNAVHRRDYAEFNHTCDVRPTPARYHHWKPGIERGLAMILLLPGLPIMFATVLLVLLTSRGPAIFRQVRTGKHGRPFVMYKIRTMVAGAEKQDSLTWTKRNDPRITRVGRVLRELHLDELPQLFNVLKGEMVLIGPRPLRTEDVAMLATKVPGYLNRLAVPPGITGLAQINLGPELDVTSVRRKLALDLEYVREAGPVLDVRLFLCTFLSLLRLPRERTMRLLRVRREVILPDPEPEGNEPATNDESRAVREFERV